MIAFRQILRASRRIAAPSTTVWNENFGSALSIKDSAVAAPTVADNSALTEDHTHQLTVSADAEAPVTIDAPKLPPAAVFLELLGVSQEQWKAAGGDMNITDLMAEKMSLLEKYKLPTERRQRLVMGTQHNRNLFIRVSPQQMEKRLKWLIQEFDLCEPEAALVICKHPSVLNYSIDNNIGKFMSFLEENGATKKQLRSMIKTHPQILGYGSKFKSLARVFYEHLGMDEKELSSIVVKVPRILSYSIQKSIEPGLKSILGYGLTKEDMIRVTIKAPKIICGPLDRMVSEKLAWLESSLDFSREQGLEVFKSQPIIFYSRLESWIETHDWALSHGKSHEDFKQMLLDTNYNILGRRKEGLNNMLDFAINVLGKEKEEVLSCSRYFGTNFLAQTVPRIAYLDYKGKDCKEYSLQELCTASNEEIFQGLDMEEAERFKERFYRIDRDKRVSAIELKEYPSMF